MRVLLPPPCPPLALLLLLLHLSPSTCGLTAAGLSDIVAYLECQGPLLLVCPTAGPARRVARHLSRVHGLTLAVRGDLPAGDGGGGGPFNSLVVCAEDWPANRTAAALSRAQAALAGNRNRWVVTCGGRIQCRELAVLEGLHVGERILFLDLADLTVFESYTINGQVPTQPTLVPLEPHHRPRH